MDIEIVTDVDKLLDLVNKKGRITFADASKYLRVRGDKIERWAELLDSGGIIDIEYPITGEPILLKKGKKKVIGGKAKIKKKDHKTVLLDLLRTAPKIRTDFAAKKLKVSKDFVERLASELEMDEYVKVEKRMLGGTFLSRGKKFPAKKPVTVVTGAEKFEDVKETETSAEESSETETSAEESSGVEEESKS